MKKIGILLLCAAFALSLAACGGAGQPSAQASSGQNQPGESLSLLGGDPATWGPAEGGSVQIPNPFEEYGTLEEAAQAAGFPLAVPEAVGGSDSRLFRAIEGGLLEVIYQKDGEETARIRKALGSEDISGDYTAYPQTETVEINGLQVTCKGADGQTLVAIWNDGDATYSATVEAGMAGEALAALLQAIK